MLLLTSMLALTCCTQDDNISCDEIDPKIADTVKVVRAEDDLMQITNLDEFNHFVKKYPTLSNNFLFYGKYPTPVLVKKIVRLTQDLYFDTLYQEVKRCYPNLLNLRANLGVAFKNIKKIDPKWSNPSINTIITGFVEGCDLAMQDNEILIGLDWFQDKDAKYRVPSQPKYILDRYTPKHLASAVLLMISDKYNKANLEDKTLLADMIAFGKSYEFVQQTLPCLEDKIILGYTDEEMQNVDHNQKIIWTHFLDNQLLYSTSFKDKRDYVFEAPVVQAIDNKCPGRIGRWLGWEIVKAYTEKTNTSLKELMEETDFQKILQKSNYKPQKK